LRGQGILWYMALTRAQIQTTPMHCTFAPSSTIQVITGNCQNYTKRCVELIMMTTSSLPIGLIINSLVTPPIRSESALPTANWQACTTSIWHRNWQWVVMLCLANDCRAYSPLPWQSFAHILDPQVTQLLYNRKQLPQEQWARIADWCQDHTDSLGPECCHQALHFREGSVFSRPR
jgi:hypothetical protein